MQKIIKKEKAITLIALVITVIILLILAGITIATLSNSGLFEKTKIAKEKYEIARQEEENKLNEYVNEINFATTRTINESEYNKLNLMMRPNEWEVSTTENPHEYDFGGGLYGQRFSDKITEKANTVNYPVIGNISDKGIIVQCGGTWSYINTGKKMILNATNDAGTVKSFLVLTSTGDLQLNTKSNSARDNAPYDIWVLYTK